MKRLICRLRTSMDALLFPENIVCPVCGKDAILDDSGVCDVCRGQFHRCGILSTLQPLDGLSAAYFYDPILRPAMHRFKYRRETWLARFFLRDIDLPANADFDAIVPVPMHPLKEYLRSYNPPEALALVLRERLPQLPIRTDLIKKIKFTPSQTTLGADERRRNVENVFHASDAVAGLSVLLVDDVTTTGSTLISCAEALKAAGARYIFAICACKATVGDEAPIDENKTED